MFFLILHILNTYLVCRCGFFLLFLLIYKDTTFKTSLFFRQMNWIQLISDKRLGLEDYHNPHSGVRSDFQRDFDRLVFSSPFRRLQNKTQVFPLPGSIFEIGRAHV